MKAIQRILRCALAVMLSSTGWARIGETLDECVARYGEFDQNPGPFDLFVFKDPEVGLYRFQKAGLEIMVEIHEGRAARIQFIRSGGFLDEDIANGLLEANAVDGAWHPVTSQEAEDLRTVVSEDAERLVRQSRSEAEARLNQKMAESIQQIMGVFAPPNQAAQWESDGKNLVASKTLLGLSIMTTNYEDWMKSRTEQQLESLRQQKLKHLEGF